MACRKYILTNNTSSNGVYSYQECSNQLWIYDILLPAGSVNNIWLTEGTFNTAMPAIVTFTDLGPFPFVVTPTSTVTSTPTPTMTPTNTATPTQTTSQTPTNTATPTETTTQTPTQTPSQTTTQTPSQTTTQTSTQTQTQTPTQTSTNTQTPTQTMTPTPSVTPPTRTAFLVYPGSSLVESCSQTLSQITVYGNDSVWGDVTAVLDVPTGPATINMTGFYNFNGISIEVDSTGQFVNISTCVTPTQTTTNTSTPTETPTNTPTPSESPTQTPTSTETPTQTPTQTATPTETTTQTPTPTPTISYWVYTLTSGATANDACTSVTTYTIYSSSSFPQGPTVGEFLFLDSALTNPVNNGWWGDGSSAFETDGTIGSPGQILSEDPC
jgi:outer membrane biosynthesis protein TonB